MTLDEARFGRGCLKIIEMGLNRSTWPTCSTQIFFLRDWHQFFGLRRIVGDRFFHQHVLALREQRFGDFKMRDGGRDNVQRIGWQRRLRRWN